MNTRFDTLKEIGTFVIALVGCVLGVYNAVRAHRRDKPKLRVRVKVRVGNFIADLAAETGEMLPSDATKWDAICIEIVNEGFIAVTVREAGFLFRNGHKYMANCPGSKNDSKIQELKRAYVMTAANQKFTNFTDMLRIKRLVMAGKTSAPANPQTAA